ncbi:hypothetical protein N8Z24_00100 [bacterium]|nr:hypothetical protein [bacterium]
MRPYFVPLGSGKDFMIIDIFNFVYYHKDDDGGTCWFIYLEKRSSDRSGDFNRLDFKSEEDRDKAMDAIFLATQEYNLDEIHDLRKTKGSKE